MSKQRIFRAAAFGLSLMACGLSASAQEQQRRVRVEAEPQRDVVITHERVPQDTIGVRAEMVEIHPGQGDNFVFIAGEMSSDGKLVKGAPYSAQSVTEMVQTLADGNRIARKNTANVYRDSEGRTRRDQTLGAIGPFAAQGDPTQTVFINDPVAGVHYILDPRSRTARKLPRFEYRFQVGDKVFKDEMKAREKIEKEAGEKVKMKHEEVETHGFTFRTPGPDGPHGPGPEVHFFGHSSKADAKTEKLDKQTIEGVMAEGTRTTVTIPAGEIGNEQPIQIVTERWYSPELQTVVMTRHSDPRFGENTYKLTNISRTEPAPALFQVPSDYTVKEPGPMHRGSGPARMRKPADN